MTSNRPYREAMPSRVARMRLAQAVGTQFDTSVVAAFEAILATAEIVPSWPSTRVRYRLTNRYRGTNACHRGRGLVAAELTCSKSRRGPRANSELLVDVSDMDLDGVGTDEKGAPDLGVRESLSHESQDLLLPW